MTTDLDKLTVKEIDGVRALLKQRQRRAVTQMTKKQREEMLTEACNNIARARASMAGSDNLFQLAGILFLILLMLMALLPPTSHAETLINLKTGSMPCFQNDSYISVDTHYPFASLKVGDVICYRPVDSKLALLRRYAQYSPLASYFTTFFTRQDAHLCHRLVYFNATRLRGATKSDIEGRLIDPFLVEPQDYYGKVQNQKCR